jgi:alkanesulfonate monooxygenase SsuD/methylene tetrahydromethanopterin reductase-like flavin-dependent oxidoreductase (luciferase family)
MVVVLPWHDPVRVAEQIAMLDMYCGDRELTLGFGRGAGRIEYDGFRVPMSESCERFSEAAEIVRMALTQDRFSYQGKYYQIPEMSVRPHPRCANLPERFYGAIISPETGDIMARQGLGMLVIPQKPWTEHKKIRSFQGIVRQVRASTEATSGVDLYVLRRDRARGE